MEWIIYVMLWIGVAMMTATGWVMLSGVVDAFKIHSFASGLKTQPVRRIDGGMTEVEGRACVLDEALRSPIDESECVLYHVFLFRFEYQGGESGMQWGRVLQGTYGVPFVLEDDTGRVRVDPQGVQAYLPGSQAQMGPSDRAVYWSGTDAPAFVDDFLDRIDEYDRHLIDGIDRKDDHTSHLRPWRDVRHAFEVHPVHPGDELYVLGPARRISIRADGSGRPQWEIGLAQEPTWGFLRQPLSTLVIATGSEAELRKTLSSRMGCTTVFALLFLGIALFFAIVLLRW